MKLLITLFCALSLSLHVNAQQNTPSPILFIYDASGSMWAQLDGKTKKDIAAEVLATSVSNLPDNQNIGLMAYGHRKKSDCNVNIRQNPYFFIIRILVICRPNQTGIRW